MKLQKVLVCRAGSITKPYLYGVIDNTKEGFAENVLIASGHFEQLALCTSPEAQEAARRMLSGDSVRPREG